MLAHATPRRASQAGVLITALFIYIMIKYCLKFCLTKSQQQQPGVIPQWELTDKAEPQQQLPPSPAMQPRYAPGGYATQQPGYASQQSGYAPQPGNEPRQLGYAPQPRHHHVHHHQRPAYNAPEYAQY
jgi:hypothetical protein